MNTRLESTIDCLGQLVNVLILKLAPELVKGEGAGHAFRGNQWSGGGGGSGGESGGGSGTGGGGGVSSPTKPSQLPIQKIPLISSENRREFLDKVVNPQAGKLKLSSRVTKKFLEDGDAESFAESLSSGGRDGLLARLRTEQIYASEFGGFDIAKSRALTDVNSRSTAVANGMTEKQRDAIQQYTTDDYYDVNKALRTGKKLSKSGQQMVNAVETAVNGVGKWPSAGIIYHGVASSSPEERQVFLDRVQKHIKEGIPWEERAILSTSASRKMSEDWIGEGRKADGGGVLMRIKAHTGAAISTFTGLSSQQEILQKPGTKYKVVGVKTEKGHRGQPVTIVDFEEIS